MRYSQSENPFSPLRPRRGERHAWKWSDHGGCNHLPLVEGVVAPASRRHAAKMAALWNTTPGFASLNRPLLGKEGTARLPRRHWPDYAAVKNTTASERDCRICHGLFAVNDAKAK